MTSLAPEEWDFRLIRPEVVDDAVLYEYARDHREVKTAMLRVLGAIVPHWSKPIKLTVRVCLLENEGRSLDHFDHILGNISDEDWLLVGQKLTELPLKYPQFPIPFVKTAMKPLKIREKPKAPFQVFNLKDAPGTLAKAFLIDESFSQNEVRDSFLDWLRKNVALDRRGQKKGQSFDDLKKLAALRMVDAEYSFNGAREAVLNRLEAFPSDSVTTVSPLYNSERDWKRAADSARSLMSKMLDGYTS